jgi:hypothetical protein
MLIENKRRRKSAKKMMNEKQSARLYSYKVLVFGSKCSGSVEPGTISVLLKDSIDSD